MKRSASLDLLRGLAALAVAIPHYLTTNAAFQPAIEAVAISGVEVFFVLSGFVLAPQIVRKVVGGPLRNLRVFLVRRWMRTIPPYLAALVAIALITGNLFTADFARYAVYAENLTHMASVRDFYPVAWSLGVEEWFYLLFAPLLFVVGLVLGRSDRRMEVAFALAFIAAVAALRHGLAPANWDLDVRRVTLFRIDSIVWGYLLFLALEGRGRRAPSGDRGRALALTAALGAAVVLATVAELRIAYAALLQDRWAQAVFPYSSAAFGMAWVAAFAFADARFVSRGVRAASFFLGRISYSVYLFHIIAVILLKPRIDAWPLAAQLALYLTTICAFSTLFWRAFEKPILAARPDYDRRERIAPAPVPPAPAASRRAALAIAASFVGAAVVTRNAFMANEPALFYPALIAAGALAVALAERAGSWTRNLGFAARTLLVFAVALPPADALYRSSTGVPLRASVAAPTYSYRAAKENPAAFASWWFYYLNEWIRDDGIRAAIEAKDPTGALPFVLKPGSSGRMFDATIRIDAHGFRGPEIATDKGDRFRIFALGESQTFGPTLHEGDRPWPEILQSLFDGARCNRPVEVVNAGTEAYTLADNIERTRAAILPLKPDLILSTHGFNGFVPYGLRRVPEPKEPGVRPRASALIGKAVLTFEQALWRWRAPRAAEPAPPPFTDTDLLASRYADQYRRLIALGRENGVAVALATSAMAVDQQSPREVKDFYGAVFKPIDDIVAANAAHNRLVRLVAKEQGVPALDMTPGLDGRWDDDLYLDIVHFTERGNARAARLLFDGLKPALARAGVRCAGEEGE